MKVTRNFRACRESDGTYTDEWAQIQVKIATLIDYSQFGTEKLLEHFKTEFGVQMTQQELEIIRDDGWEGLKQQKFEEGRLRGDHFDYGKNDQRRSVPRDQGPGFAEGS